MKEEKNTVYLSDKFIKMSFLQACERCMPVYSKAGVDTEIIPVIDKSADYEKSSRFRVLLNCSKGMKEVVT